MGTWKDIREEILQKGSTYDILRHDYLNKISELTGRNTIAYYSCFCQKQDNNDNISSINDDDMNGFMNSVKDLQNREKGLNLIIHTQGGLVRSVEQIVQYLRKKFNFKLFSFIPHIAYSGGTLIALSSTEIYMGDHSNLGPVDPQIGGLSAFNIVNEVNNAKKEISEDEKKALFWQPIISKYSIGIIQNCLQSIERVKDLTFEYLKSGMFSDKSDEFIHSIVKEFIDNSLFKEHDKPFNIDKLIQLGLKIKRLEDNSDLQDLILSLHHCYTLTFQNTDAIKIIENNLGQAYIITIRSIPMKIPQQK